MLLWGLEKPRTCRVSKCGVKVKGGKVKTGTGAVEQLVTSEGDRLFLLVEGRWWTTHMVGAWIPEPRWTVTAVLLMWGLDKSRGGFYLARL